MASTYTITYNSNYMNGMEETSWSETVTYGSNYTTHGSLFVAPEDHIFVGWNTKSDGTGSDWTDWEGVWDWHYDVNVYAQWKRRITINYCNYKYDYITTQEAFKDETILILDNQGVTLGGDIYSLGGWLLEDSSGQTIIPAGSQWSFNNDVTLKEVLLLRPIFDVDHDNINPNYFVYNGDIRGDRFETPSSKLVQCSGVNVSVDEVNSILTLDGTQQASFNLGIIDNLKFTEGEKYTVTLYYVDGNYDSIDNNTIPGTFNFDIRNNTDARMGYFDTHDLPTKDNPIISGTLTISPEQAHANLIWCWFWKSAESGFIFNNYKIKIKIEKSEEPTEFSPNARIYPDDGAITTYGELPSVKRAGYNLKEWKYIPHDMTINSDMIVSYFYNTITAIWEPSSFTFLIKTNGEWLPHKPYVKNNGEWKEIINVKQY